MKIRLKRNWMQEKHDVHRAYLEMETVMKKGWRRKTLDGDGHEFYADDRWEEVPEETWEDVPLDRLTTNNGGQSWKYNGCISEIIKTEKEGIYKDHRLRRDEGWVKVSELWLEELKNRDANDERATVWASDVLKNLGKPRPVLLVERRKE